MHHLLANAQRSYRQHATLTAPPARVVLLLYDGALAFLERAQSGFLLADPCEKNAAVHNNVARAQNILRALRLALDLERGGQLAATLDQLYDYFDRRLQRSNLKKERGGIEEVSGHLTSLRDAWGTMVQGRHEPIQAGNRGRTTSAAT